MNMTGMKKTYVQNGSSCLPLLKIAARKNGEGMAKMLERLIIQEYDRLADIPLPEKKTKSKPKNEIKKRIDLFSETIKILTENKKMSAREFHKVLIERTGVSQKTVTRLKLKMIQEKIIGKEKQNLFLKGNP